MPLSEVHFQANIDIFAVEVVLFVEASDFTITVGIKHKTHSRQPIDLLLANNGGIIGLIPTMPTAIKQTQWSRHTPGTIFKTTAWRHYTWTSNTRRTC
jgi:hypothetical protein